MALVNVKTSAAGGIGIGGTGDSRLATRDSRGRMCIRLAEGALALENARSQTRSCRLQLQSNVARTRDTPFRLAEKYCSNTILRL